MVAFARASESQLGLGHEYHIGRYAGLAHEGIMARSDFAPFARVPSLSCAIHFPQRPVLP